jgi:hypothetical protein
MMGRDSRVAVEAALLDSRDIPKAEYLRWARQEDLATRARAYRLSESQWARIKPEPSMAEQCGFMADYLLTCLLEDPNPDGYVHTSVEAGGVLVAWLKHLSTIPAASAVVTGVAARLAESYKRSDCRARARIETVVLEHVLESPRLRPVFEAWCDDPALRDAYAAALAWGLAHPDDAD